MSVVNRLHYFYDAMPSWPRHQVPRYFRHIYRVNPWRLHLAHAYIIEIPTSATKILYLHMYALSKGTICCGFPPYSSPSSRHHSSLFEASEALALRREIPQQVYLLHHGRVLQPTGGGSLPEPVSHCSRFFIHTILLR